MIPRMGRFLLIIVILFAFSKPVSAAPTYARMDSPAVSGSDVPGTSEGVDPTGLLNPDGTINLSRRFNGALDLANWNVKLDPQRGPVLSPSKTAGANMAGADQAIAPAAAQPQVGSWRGIGAGGGVLDDQVESIAVSGSNVYVAGDFTNAGNNPAADYVAKWNGSSWSALGSNSNGDGSLNSFTHAVVVIPPYVYVGGFFTTVSNSSGVVATAARAARFNETTGQWSGLGDNGANGPSLNNEVNTLVADGQYLYVGGRFTDVKNGAATLSSADYVARFDLQSSQWSALGTGLAGNGAIDTPNTQVAALAVTTTDVYVGGYFTDLKNNGATLTAADYVARWNKASGNWSALGSGASGNGAISGPVIALAANGSDLYVGGYFTNVNNNGTVLQTADWVAKWDGSQWSAPSGGGNSGALSNAPMGLLVNNGYLYLAGSFVDANGMSTADYVARYQLASGTWSAFGSDGAGGGAIARDSFTRTLAVQGSSLLVGGYFWDVNNNGTALLQADFLAAWNGSNWSSVGSDSNGALVNGYANSGVWAIVVNGSDIYVGGNFSNVSNNGVNIPEADYVARWDGNRWWALNTRLSGDGNGDGALKNQVRSLVILGGKLYVAGDFINADGIATADHLASYDLTAHTWANIGSNGSGDGALNQVVFALAPTDTGQLYVGGSFTNAGGLTCADRVARWNGLTWNCVGNNGAGEGSLTNGSVFALLYQAPELFVGGSFTDVSNFGTTLTAADYLVVWNSGWFALGSGPGGDGSFTASVRAFAVDGLKLYVGGDFTDVRNGSTINNAADYIVTWNGTTWDALSGFPNLYGSVNAIQVFQHDIYLGGGFSKVHTGQIELTAASYVVRWNGTAWIPLGTNTQVNPSLNQTVHALALNGYDLLVGGEFTDALNGGTTTVKEADYLAAFRMDLPLHNYLPVAVRP